MCVRVCGYLRGWTQDLRVTVGDTSSYLRGDDTSKLVTPSEACWEGTNESYKQIADTVWAGAYLSVLQISVSVLFLLCAGVKGKCLVHGTRCCSPPWHHPGSPTSVRCTTLLPYLTREETKNRQKLTIVSLLYVYIYEMKWQMTNSFSLLTLTTTTHTLQNDLC